ncbi:hypothetical protein BDW22DRAFT_385417 [Trametopsis cervina]|nr:hypothetical protein BDW22DRAFT_385417 [Trametopsis cervina]
MQTMMFCEGGLSLLQGVAVSPVSLFLAACYSPEVMLCSSDPLLRYVWCFLAISDLLTGQLVSLLPFMLLAGSVTIPVLPPGVSVPLTCTMDDMPTRCLIPAPPRTTTHGSLRDELQRGDHPEFLS